MCTFLRAYRYVRLDGIRSAPIAVRGTILGNNRNRLLKRRSTPFPPFPQPVAPRNPRPPQSGLISPIHPTELNEETKDLFRYFPAGNERQSRAFLMWTGISPLIPASPLPVQKPRVPRGAFLCPKGHPQKAENYGARKLVSRCYEIIRMGKTCGNIRDLRQMFASTWLGAGPIDAVSAESKK